MRTEVQGLPNEKKTPAGCYKEAKSCKSSTRRLSLVGDSSLCATQSTCSSKDSHAFAYNPHSPHLTEMPSPFYTKTCGSNRFNMVTTGDDDLPKVMQSVNSRAQLGRRAHTKPWPLTSTLLWNHLGLRVVGDMVWTLK